MSQTITTPRAAQAALIKLRSAQGRWLQASRGLEQALATRDEAVLAARQAGATIAAVATILGRTPSNTSRTYGTNRDLGLAADHRGDATSELAALRRAQAAIANHRRAVNAATAARVAAVAACREAGVTWDAIGAETGMARSNVVTYFRPQLVEKRTVRPKAAGTR